jgi:MoxR-like ATPase
VRRLPVGDSVVEAILALVRSARPGPEGGELRQADRLGTGPRASQSLMLAVRARALLDGRWRPRSTTCSIWPSRCSSTAWR